jgi:uncharacterized protein (DUF362 family)
MDRRRFIASGAAVLLAHQFQIGRWLNAQTRDLPGGPVVWETEGVSYESVSALLEAFGGGKRLFADGPSRATVVIKPNLCLPDPGERGTTTSLAVVELFCRRLIAEGVKRIIVADHTLGNTLDFRGADLLALPKLYPEVKVLLANEERMFEPVDVPGKVLQRVERMKVLANADFFVNLATAKHHSGTHVSLGVKNLMGAIWNRSDFHTKMDLASAIGDLALAVRPSINVIDASRVLLSGGPTGPGTIVDAGRLYASRDIVAVDAVVASRYSFGGKSLRPSDVAHLRAAAENGVGEIELQRITVKKV